MGHSDSLIQVVQIIMLLGVTLSMAIPGGDNNCAFGENIIFEFKVMAIMHLVKLLCFQITTGAENCGLRILCTLF
jgi:hypothetical protein